MAKKKIDTRQLVDRIQRLTRDRMLESEVVSIDEFRDLTRKDEPKTILIIDDDETIRNGLKRLFEREGYRVLPAADGTQLTTVLDDSPIDLVILDIGLPWINGYELAKMMKENDDLRTIPLIFVSAKTGELDVRRGFDLGADDYIKKPFDVEEVRKAVNTLLALNGQGKKR